MNSIEYEDLHAAQVQGMYCEKCGGHLSLVYEDFARMVSRVEIIIRALPTLFCPECASTFLPERSRLAVMRIYEDAKSQNAGSVQVNRKKIEEKFEFTDVPFLYDPDDYYYMPGLAREWDRGYLTPVFFKKQVLIKFDHLEYYRLEFASRTYGLIRASYYDIAFGINLHDKVIMWLGDIAKLPSEEQYYLRSENVDSDHCLGSEFYDAQIECKFTDPTVEDLIIRARSTFVEVCSGYFNTILSHLDDETLDAIGDFRPPTVFTRREKQRLTILVNQICVESLNSKTLGDLLRARQIDQEGLGSLKRLELLFQHEFPAERVSAHLSPFFVAYDLRVAYAHLTSNKRREELTRTASQRLGLSDESAFDAVYERLLTRLVEGYARLTDLIACRASPAPSRPQPD